MTVAAPTEVPVLHWDEFLDEFTWYQGEHVTGIAPTGSGKTTLFRELLRRARREGTHPYQILVATKKRDEIFDSFSADGFVKMPRWEVYDAEVFPRVMLAPPLPSADKKAVQAERIRECLVSVYQTGGWLIFLDELKHIAKYLGLEADVELLLHAGKSAKITVVSAVQRPRHVPLMAYDQADHLFMWESRDSNIRKRLGEIGGKVDPDVLECALENLPDKHTFLYVNMSTGKVIQSKVAL